MWPILKLSSVSLIVLLCSLWEGCFLQKTAPNLISKMGERLLFRTESLFTCPVNVLKMNVS
jgi:hypothetical protein